MKEIILILIASTMLVMATGFSFSWYFFKKDFIPMILTLILMAAAIMALL